jgi:hypothetical protein
LRKIILTASQRGMVSGDLINEYAEVDRLQRTRTSINDRFGKARLPPDFMLLQEVPYFFARWSPF